MGHVSPVDRKMPLESSAHLAEACSVGPQHASMSGDTRETEDVTDKEQKKRRYRQRGRGRMIWVDRSAWGGWSGFYRPGKNERRRQDARAEKQQFQSLNWYGE